MEGRQLGWCIGRILPSLSPEGGGGGLVGETAFSLGEPQQFTRWGSPVLSYGAGLRSKVLNP